MPGIFICYRRDDSAPYAGRLYDRLIHRFGEDGVFMDVDAIEPGEDFVEVLNKKVRACHVFVAVIGRQWLTSRDETGSRRLDNPEDFVRLEIAAAIDRKIRIIPTLVGGATMPREQDLPSEVKALARRQAVELSDKRFHRDVALLIEAFETLEEPAPDERSAPEPIYMRYDVAVDGITERREIPLVVGVLADFCPQPEEVPEPFMERRFVDINPANFDRVMSALRPRLALRVNNTLNKDSSELMIVLRFRSLTDFDPEAVGRQIEPLRKLLDTRSALAELLGQYSRGLATLMDEVLRSPQFAAEISSDDPQVDDLVQRRIDELGLVADPFELRRSLSAVAELKLPPGADLPGELGSRIALMDEIVSRHVGEVLRADAFRELEATWRGLHYLVTHMERIGVKVRVLNVSKGELVKDFKRAPEFDQCQLFKKVYDAEYGTAGGEPFAVLVGDYYFGRHPADVDALKEISKVAAASQAVFIGGTAPTMFGVQSFRELSSVQNIANRFEGIRFEKWKRFRESEDARWVGLALPRMLLRLPYRESPDSILVIQNAEDTTAAAQACAWGNPAYPLALSLLSTFAQPPWRAPIPEDREGSEPGIEVPTVMVPLDSGKGMAESSAEVAITDHWREQVAAQGFAPMCSGGDGTPRFFDIPSCRLPQCFRTDERTLSAWLSTRLPYSLAISRTAHYLRAILRCKASGYRSAHELENYLTGWIRPLVTTGDSGGAETQARVPFSEALIEVTELPDRPGSFRVVAHLRPRVEIAHVPAEIRLPPGAQRSFAAEPFRLVGESFD